MEKKKKVLHLGHAIKHHCKNVFFFLNRKDIHGYMYEIAKWLITGSPGFNNHRVAFYCVGESYRRPINTIGRHNTAITLSCVVRLDTGRLITPFVQYHFRKPIAMYFQST